MSTKRQKQGKSRQTKTSKYIDKLKAQNEKLSADNAELVRLLSAKRYKAMSFAVDSTYHVLRKMTKKKQLLDRANKTLELEKFLIAEQLLLQDKEGAANKKPTRRKRKVVKGKVDIINMNFYDWGGKAVYKGGAERYVYDLACLLKELGYTARILQCSNEPFEKEYEGVTVVGIGQGDKGSMRVCSSIYNEYCEDAELLIASPLELASEIKDIPIIGINHGVNFDGNWNKWDKDAPHRYDIYMDALNNVMSCVCVDTNFINFTRTQDYALALKERYIPNYYNQESFPTAHPAETKDKIVFVYPRRLYEARGFDITVKAFEKILPKYKDQVILKFVGQVDNDGVKETLEKFMKEFPDNVFHYEYSMDKMPEAYKDADVVLVPTEYSEGTSLSCIEGMASGAAIITTNVGGLPNLVIDGYNGMIISPTADSLAAAVLQMIKKPKLRQKLAENGVSVAQSAFTKDNWDNSWKDEIKKTFKKLNRRRS